MHNLTALDPCQGLRVVSRSLALKLPEKESQLAWWELCGTGKEGMKDVAGFAREAGICDTNDE
jgi:hypothetical protein